MKQNKISIYGIIMLFLMMSLACSLTSPTPASWSRTPTAQARAETSAAVALTQDAVREQAESLKTPTPKPTEEKEILPEAGTINRVEGPWLVYSAGEDGILFAYDLASEQTIEIALPEPIYVVDLDRGLSPEGGTLIIRAGSPENLDELALYKIHLPGAEISQISPLLSLTLQRDIVNNTDDEACETLQAVTREDGIAWSPNGQYFAFNAALDNQSSDLYVYDTVNDRVDRLNGLSTQNGGLFWTPGGNTLVSQEFGELDKDENTWNSLYVTGIQVPGFDDQNTLYFPSSESIGEVFVGWLNNQTFVSYSRIPSGMVDLRQVNFEKQDTTVSFEGLFDSVCLDPITRMISLVIGGKSAERNEIAAGVYLLKPESTSLNLQRAGDWDSCVWDTGGKFVVGGSHGVFIFSNEGDEIFLPDEGGVRLSPSGSWMVGWGDGEDGALGARLYQTSSSRPLQELSEESITDVLWQPDSKGFFLLGKDTLYRLEFPALNLEIIKEELLVNETIKFTWVE